MPTETIHQAAVIAEDLVRYERVKKKGLFIYIYIYIYIYHNYIIITIIYHNYYYIF